MCSTKLTCSATAATSISTSKRVTQPSTQHSYISQLWSFAVMPPAHTPNNRLVFWQPSPSHVASSSLASFTRLLNQFYEANISLGDYDALHKWSIQNLPAFWAAVVRFANFITYPAHIPLRDVLNPGPRQSTLPDLVNVVWLQNIRLNFTETALQYYLKTPKKPAIVFRPESSADDQHRSQLTFEQLHRRVTSLATSLRAAGIRRADNVAAILPNTPDAYVAMLAVAAVGAVWCCCSPDYGENAIHSRFVQIRPKALFYTSSYLYKGKQYNITPTISQLVTKLPSLQILIRAAPNYTGHDDFSSLNPPQHIKHYALPAFEQRGKGSRSFEYEKLTMADPVVTVFSSGTTGRPKCIIQGAGILLNQMKEHRLHLELSDYSIMFFNTSTGWMLFNWLLAALASGITIISYDGAAIPKEDPLRLVNIARQEGVTHFGSGAKYFQTLQAVIAADDSLTAQFERQKPIPSLEVVMATGSPSSIEHFTFSRDFFGSGVQYVSLSGGTEINGCFALGSPWKPVIAPELQCAGLGMDVCVFNHEGQQVEEQNGELVCRNACPCMPLYFGHDDRNARYRDSYFSQFGDKVWGHGDFAIKKASGGFVILGRSDSTLNPGGVRIGTADLYEIMDTLDFIADSLVAEQSFGSDARVIMLVVIEGGRHLDHNMESNIRDIIRKRLSPRHVPSAIVQVPDVPYTFSGKKCEIPVKKILNGYKEENREAVQNPESFDSIRSALQQKGILVGEKGNTALPPASKM